MSDASDYTENAVADWMGGNADPAATGTRYVKLHIGAPGDDGTANAAAETTREAASFGAAAAGVVTSDADVSWTSVSNSETYSHFSIWDAVSAGNCIAVGALDSPVAVTAGDNFTIPTGDLDITVA